MNSNYQFVMIAYLLVITIPTLLVSIGGAVTALIRWRRHPRVSLLTLLGCGFLLVPLLLTFVYRLLLPWLVGIGSTAQWASWIGLGASGFSALLSAIGIAFLLCAVFAERGKS